METQLLEDMEKQFSLVKKLIALKTDKDELLEEAHKIEKIGDVKNFVFLD